MDAFMRRKQSFLLRLPMSLREQATKMSQEEGVSLNHFIAIAVAEKLSRMEYDRREHKSTNNIPASSVRPIRMVR
jgi:hypothetical protein